MLHKVHQQLCNQQSLEKQADDTGGHCKSSASTVHTAVAPFYLEKIQRTGWKTHTFSVWSALPQQIAKCFW